MLQNRLRELRKEVGLTQQELGKKLDTSQQVIGFWETGKQNPRPDSICKLADFFNVSTDYLLGRTDLPRYITNSGDNNIVLAENTGTISYTNNKSNRDEEQIKDERNLILLFERTLNNQEKLMETMQKMLENQQNILHAQQQLIEKNYGE